MKLSILLAGSILTSAIVDNVYAQTCAKPPSCTELGYTYTGSTSDCLSPALKCPFDTSYFNCVKKNEMVNTFAPNYNSARILSADGTTYTVGSGTLASYSCGWVLFENYDVNGGLNRFSYWYINNKEVGRQASGAGNAWTTFNSAIFFVNKNDTFKNAGQAGVNKLTFYPCKSF